MKSIAAPCGHLAYASLAPRRAVRSNKQHSQTSYQAHVSKLNTSAKLSHARQAAASSKFLSQSCFLSGESRIHMHRAAARSARRVLSVHAGLLKEKLKVLVVGGGGREHALAWKMSLSPFCEQLFCAPGNPGIAEEENITCLKGDKLNIDDHAAVVSFCKENNVELIVVGPEAPLVAGLSDSLREAGFKVFGPSKAAAELEGSKAFMKDICAKYNVDTAAYAVFDDAEKAKAYVKEQGAPIVVKADGLAAGKGVIVAMDEKMALDAIDDMLVGNVFGSAGSRVVIEEYMAGEEASFFAITDGKNVFPLVSAQDHKPVGEGDTGPNTGGMGAYSPAPVVTPEIERMVVEDIVQPTVDGMAKEGVPFQGVLFAGLMIQNGHPRLLEYNVRFGDPECQTLMMRLQSDLLELLYAASSNNLDALEPLTWSEEVALLVVHATKGYPGSYEKGSRIRNLAAANAAAGTKVFHAGTDTDAEGNVVATGGRVLGVTAIAADVRAAQAAAYEGLDKIDWPEGFCRRDIGWRAVARLDE